MGHWAVANSFLAPLQIALNQLTNPYAPPTTELERNAEYAKIRRRVSRPATALLVMASIHAVFVTIHLVSAGFVYFQRAGSGFSLLMTCLAAAQLFGLIVISIGAAKLGVLQSYRMASMGSILACIPLVTPFVWLGIPFGIWALRLLADAEVRGAFPDRLALDPRAIKQTDD